MSIICLDMFICVATALLTVWIGWRLIFYLGGSLPALPHKGLCQIAHFYTVFALLLLLVQYMMHSAMIGKHQIEKWAKYPSGVPISPLSTSILVYRPCEHVSALVSSIHTNSEVAEMVCPWWGHNSQPGVGQIPPAPWPHTSQRQPPLTEPTKWFLIRKISTTILGIFVF